MNTWIYEYMFICSYVQMLWCVCGGRSGVSVVRKWKWKSFANLFLYLRKPFSYAVLKMQYKFCYIAFVTLCDFSDFCRFCPVFHGYSRLCRFFTQTQRITTNHHELQRISHSIFIQYMHSGYTQLLDTHSIPDFRLFFAYFSPLFPTTRKILRIACNHHETQRNATNCTFTHTPDTPFVDFRHSIG